MELRSNTQFSQTFNSDKFSAASREEREVTTGDKFSLERGRRKREKGRTERSGVSTAALRHLTTNYIVVGHFFPDMLYISMIGHVCMTLTMPQSHLTRQRVYFTW